MASLEEKKAIMVKALGKSASPMLVFMLITVYIAINFFGFGLAQTAFLFASALVGEIVGTVALKIDEIDDLIVNRKYQGKGYGKQILLWAIKNIQTQKPILHVAGWNEKAIVLYKNVGFEIIETIEI